MKTFVRGRSKLKSRWANNADRQDLRRSKNKRAFIPYLRLVKDGFVRLCNCSSLHGFKYITDKSKTIGERIIWSLICLASVIVCGIYIFASWNRWVSVPFNLVLDKEYTPLYDVPFPTVTICPQHPLKRSMIDLDKTDNRVVLFAASLVCNHMRPENYSLPDSNFNEDVEQQIYGFIRRNAPTCNEVIKRCKWKPADDQVVDETFDCCTELFETVMTDRGLCFTFNMAKWSSINKTDTSVNYWDPERGYDFERLSVRSYPRRIFNIGKDSGLTVELYANSSENQEICAGNDVGFKVLLDHPYENVMMQNFASIPTERLITFLISPQVVNTDESMRYVSPEIRRCFFESENKLKYESFYTQSNCVFDCEMRHIIETCNCMPFVFGSKTVDPSQKKSLCMTYKQHMCILRVKADVNLMSIVLHHASKTNTKVNYTRLPERIRKLNQFCRCYPNCADVRYGSEVYYSDMLMDTTEHFNTSIVKSSDFTCLHMTYKETLFLGIHREMSYDTMDFISAIGGVLSLFLGFSIMSLIEVMYYIILKPLMTIISNDIKACIKK